MGDVADAQCLKKPIDQYFDTDKIIGMGGFASVVSARPKDSARVELDPSLPDEVAIKVVKIKQGLKMQHIIDEIRIIKSIDSPYSIKYYGCFEPLNMNTLYIVMEYFKAPELFDILKDGIPVLSGGDKIEIVRQLAHGISTLHDSQIVHRDLKPENILLKTNPIQIKIIDYGLACYDAQPDELDGVGRCDSDRPIGTPGYIDPILLRNKRLTVEQLKLTDWWAFGQITWNVFAGTPESRFLVKPPATFRKPNQSELLYIPAEYQHLMIRLLDPTLEERPSASEILSTLNLDLKPELVPKPYKRTDRIVLSEIIQQQ